MCVVPATAHQERRADRSVRGSRVHPGSAYSAPLAGMGSGHSGCWLQGSRSWVGVIDWRHWSRIHGRQSSLHGRGLGRKEQSYRRARGPWQLPTLCKVVRHTTLREGGSYVAGRIRPAAPPGTAGVDSRASSTSSGMPRRGECRLTRRCSSRTPHASARACTHAATPRAAPAAPRGHGTLETDLGVRC